MPTYVYKFVDTGETIEVQQGFHDDTLTEVAHPESGEMLPVKKVFTPVGVTFKGSGFFKTDNRGKSSAANTSGSASTGDSGSKDSGSGSKDSGSKDSASSSSSSGTASGSATSASAGGSSGSSSSGSSGSSSST